MAEWSDASAAPLVLVADDDETVRDLVCEVLAGAGFRTVSASDGVEVPHLARLHRPAVIVLDVMMPSVDGYATLIRLRGHPLTRDIPVIILTGQHAPLYRTLSVGVGATAHLAKPFLPEQLVETVRQVLGWGPT